MIWQKSQGNASTVKRDCNCLNRSICMWTVSFVYGSDLSLLQFLDRVRFARAGLIFTKLRILPLNLTERKFYVIDIY